MPLSASIALQIPYLRRFARALTGSQASGDAYAVAALEAFVEAGSPPPGQRAARQSLFRVFFTIWGSIPLNRQGNQQGAGDAGSALMDAADRTLEGLTPLPRAVFLLRALEGFNTAEIAAIVDRPLAEVQTLLEDAGRQIAAQLRTEVLIIEDEPMIAMDLETLLIELGHSVMRIVRTHAEAVAVIARQRPGLVLADIQLADGSSGLDAVNEILSVIEVPVVFVTAYPERLLTGVRPEPTFLITKPFNPDAVKAIVSQALFFDRRASLVYEAAGGA